jgi:hypothetical protein
MNCCDVQENLSAFFDAELGTGLIARTFEHAGTCSDCQAFLLTVHNTRPVIHALASESVPRRLDKRILNIPATHRSFLTHLISHVRSTIWQTKLLVPAPAVIAAIALVVVTSLVSLTLWLDVRHQPRQSEPSVVYVVELPEVEIRGTLSAPGKQP